MAECTLITGCIFFNDKMANMPATAEIIKKSYCRTDNSKCARFMVYQKLGRSKVPSDLAPIDIERVEKISST